MHSSQRHSPQHRDRGLTRVRHLTASIALAGIAAAGWLTVSLAHNIPGRYVLAVTPTPQSPTSTTVPASTLYTTPTLAPTTVATGHVAPTTTAPSSPNPSGAVPSETPTTLAPAAGTSPATPSPNTPATTPAASPTYIAPSPPPIVVQRRPVVISGSSGF